MLGLVEYSDSDDEREQQTAAPGQQQQAAGGSGGAAGGSGSSAAPARAAGAPASQPTSRLPSAAELLGDGKPVPAMRLPPPDFGQPAVGRGAGTAGPPAAGAKRGHPDVRGPLPNPMSLDNKLQRSGGMLNVGGAKPALPGGILLPPQLRGRANVATEDLSSMFTQQSHRAAQQRSSGGGSSGGGGGGSGAS